jgi:hypothetical protein
VPAIPSWLLDPLWDQFSAPTLDKLGEEEVIDAFFDLADAIITLRRLIREAWTLYRWDTRPAKRP